MKNNGRTKKIVLTSLFAAIICITTMIHIPTGVNGGYVHVGDAFIYLAACILPLPYAMIAGAIGGGLSDLFSGAALWMIPTIIIKPILVLFFTRSNKKIINTRNVSAVFFAGITGVLLYMLAEGIIFGNLAAAFMFSLLGLVQPVGSAIVFIILGFALDKIEIKNKVAYEG